MDITLGQIENTLTATELIDAGIALHKYADPVEGPRANLTAEEAEEIAGEDCGLVYFEAQQLLGKDLGAFYPLVDAGRVVGIVDAQEPSEDWVVHESYEYATPVH